ncbi:MAG TPA: hypothetical protein VFC00_38030 [Micromonosporaceae bacterium]|nr:hypothetical protein [Micromonosporaceae bacterium]
MSARFRHAARSSSPRAGLWVTLLALTLVAVVGAVYLTGRPDSHASVGVRGATPSPTTPSPTAAPTVSPTPAVASVLLHPGPVQIDSPGFWSWALLEQKTGTISGSANMAATGTTASMIKAWIAADFLRRSTERGQTPSNDRLSDISSMIRDSNNVVADELFPLVGDAESIKRMIRICGLTESAPYRDWWSNTTVSARDTARLADCISDGRAAGPQWTNWLLEKMRLVRGAGNFGIRLALPDDVAAQTAIKNGWVERSDGNWHVACLAIGDGWTLGVLARYPSRLGVSHGAKICESVAAQLIAA